MPEDGVEGGGDRPGLARVGEGDPPAEFGAGEVVEPGGVGDAEALVDVGVVDDAEAGEGGADPVLLGVVEGLGPDGVVAEEVVELGLREPGGDGHGDLELGFGVVEVDEGGEVGGRVGDFPGRNGDAALDLPVVVGPAAEHDVVGDGASEGDLLRRRR
ncbi:MAG: hypothetical protein R3B49_06925 [Phycisphaerales bacterium]